MRSPFTLALALAGLSGGLLAYGVSPAQYTNGQSQDNNSAARLQMPNPGPQPVPGNTVAPGMPGQSLPFQPGPLAVHAQGPPGLRFHACA